MVRFSTSSRITASGPGRGLRPLRDPDAAEDSDDDV
jgi:hypothetical protein